MTTRRTFTPEFKLEPANLVLDQGYSISQACRALDVGQTALKRWVDQLQLERTGQAPTTTALTPEQREIQQLKARIHKAKHCQITMSRIWCTLLRKLLAQCPNRTAI